MIRELICMLTISMTIIGKGKGAKVEVTRGEDRTTENTPGRTSQKGSGESKSRTKETGKCIHSPGVSND